MSSVHPVRSLRSLRSRSTPAPAALRQEPPAPGVRAPWYTLSYLRYGKRRNNPSQTTDQVSQTMNQPMNGKVDRREVDQREVEHRLLFTSRSRHRPCHPAQVRLSYF